MLVYRLQRWTTMKTTTLAQRLVFPWVLLAYTKLLVIYNGRQKIKGIDVGHLITGSNCKLSAI